LIFLFSVPHNPEIGRNEILDHSAVFSAGPAGKRSTTNRVLVPIRPYSTLFRPPYTLTPRPHNRASCDLFECLACSPNPPPPDTPVQRIPPIFEPGKLACNTSRNSPCIFFLAHFFYLTVFVDAHRLPSFPPPTDFGLSPLETCARMMSLPSSTFDFLPFDMLSWTAPIFRSFFFASSHVQAPARLKPPPWPRSLLRPQNCWPQSRLRFLIDFFSIFDGF